MKKPYSNLQERSEAYSGELHQGCWLLAAVGPHNDVHAGFCRGLRGWQKLSGGTRGLLAVNENRRSESSLGWFSNTRRSCSLARAAGKPVRAHSICVSHRQSQARRSWKWSCAHVCLPAAGANHAFPLPASLQSWKC